MRSAEVLPYSLGLDLTWAPRWQKQTLAQLDQQRDWARKPEPRVCEGPRRTGYSREQPQEV